MFEENKNNMEQDLIFRSILKEGMEPAPAHVWDRIEEDLDKIAHRRRTVLWFRRTAIGVAAAAALALGLFMDRGTDADLVSPTAGEGIIAVVEEPAAVSAEDKMPELMAMAAKPFVKHEPKHEAGDAVSAEVTVSKPVTTSTEVTADTRKTESEKPRKEKGTYDDSERFPDVWPEDEVKKDRKGVSLVLSGITGTNSAQNGSRVNPMKRPGISAAPKKTGIKETSTNTAYGIPVSFGAGIRMDMTPKWSIGTGLNYTLLTRTFYGNYTQVGDNGGIVRDISSDIRGSQHYIGIPVNLYYDIVERDNISFYAYAGGAVEKCVSDKYRVLNTDIVHTEKVKGVQLSADLGMGVEFLLGRHLGIYLDPSLRYYFNNGQPKSIRTVQPLMFGFEMGLRARL